MKEGAPGAEPPTQQEKAMPKGNPAGYLPNAKGKGGKKGKGKPNPFTKAVDKAKGGK